MIEARLPRPRAVAAIAAGCALAASACACGGSQHAHTSGTTTASRSATATTATSTTATSTTATSASTASPRPAGPRYVRRTLRSGRSGVSGAVRLVSLGTVGARMRVSMGTLSYRCSRLTGASSASLGGRVDATERVYVEADRRRHLRAGTLQPPGRLAIAARGTRTLAWHIIQSSEGWTLDGRIVLRFRPGLAHGGVGCSGVRWTSFVGVISHAGRWTAPRSWL